MCYIFSCFGWALDFIQRAITFALACLMCGVVCFGLLVAVAAGVAYGYNYCMAEFLTFTRSDTNVYMRRGQFMNTPELDKDRDTVDLFDSRRSNKEEQLLGINKTTDYKDAIKARAKVLLDSWGQVKDSKLAGMLTKYSLKKKNEAESVPEPFEINLSPPPTASPLVLTTQLQSGTSHIVMRKFQTINIETTTMQRNDNYFYLESEQTFDKSTEEPKVVTRPLSPILKMFEDKYRATQYIPMRHWDTTRKRETQDEMYADDLDEENMFYKMKSV